MKEVKREFWGRPAIGEKVLFHCLKKSYNEKSQPTFDE